eukprot:3388442-Pyramimonas_sp.AAC.1
MGCTHGELHAVSNLDCVLDVSPDVAVVAVVPVAAEALCSPSLAQNFRVRPVLNASFGTLEEAQ